MSLKVGFASNCPDYSISVLTGRTGKTPADLITIIKKFSNTCHRANAPVFSFPIISPQTPGTLLFTRPPGAVDIPGAVYETWDYATPVMDALRDAGIETWMELPITQANPITVVQSCILKYPRTQYPNLAGFILDREYIANYSISYLTQFRDALAQMGLKAAVWGFGLGAPFTPGVPQVNVKYMYSGKGFSSLDQMLTTYAKWVNYYGDTGLAWGYVADPAIFQTILLDVAAHVDKLINVGFNTILFYDDGVNTPQIIPKLSSVPLWTVPAPEPTPTPTPTPEPIPVPVDAIDIKEFGKFLALIATFCIALGTTINKAEEKKDG